MKTVTTMGLTSDGHLEITSCNDSVDDDNDDCVGEDVTIVLLKDSLEGTAVNNVNTGGGWPMSRRREVHGR